MKTPAILRSRSPLAARLSALLLACLGAPSASAEIYFWDNNGATAGFGTAAGTWAVPTVGDAAQGWSTSSTGELLPAAVTTTTADVLNFGNGATGLVGGTITVSGMVDANKINFASGSGAITLSGGTILLGGTAPTITSFKVGQTIGSGITLNANTSILTGITGNPVLNLNGPIDGSANLTFSTTNTNFGGANTFVYLGAANTYAGDTTITAPNTTAGHNNSLVVRAAIIDALPTTTALTLDGYAGVGSGRLVAYDLNGNDQTLAGLSNVSRTSRLQRILNNTSASATLTINNTADFTFSGNINGTGISLAKSGPGIQTLSAANLYDGTTTVSGGKLVGVVGGNQSNSDVTVANVGATYGIFITDNTKSWTSKSVTFSAAGTLEFDFGAVAPSASISPLLITDLADFTLATPEVDVIFTAPPLPGIYPLMTWGLVDGTIPETGSLSVAGLGAGTAASLSVTGTTLNLVISGTATGIVKANNTNNLNLGSSWVGNVAPTADDVAVWNSTVTSANTTVLGADLTWAGIKIENPSGPVTINAGNTLALGSAPLDIDMAAATADLTLNSPLALASENVWNVATDRTLAINGEINGAFSITKTGPGAATLGSLNNYTGDTIISAGTLRIDTADSIPFGSGFGNVAVDGKLDLNGFNQSINSLTGSGVIDNTAPSSTVTLTLGENNANGTFEGTLENNGFLATLDLFKTGSGTMALGGKNTMDGSVTVANGTLALDNVDPFGSASGISMAGGTTLRPKFTNTLVYTPITLGSVGTTATITAPLFPDNNVGATTPKTVEFQGAISGDGNLTLLGVNTFNQYGTIILSAQSDYAGSTLLDCAGTNAHIFVSLGTNNALPPTTVLTLDGGNGTGSSPGRYCEVNLNGNNQTLAGLTNVSGLTLRVQRIRNTSATPATLTVNNAADHTYTAQLGNGGANMGLTKSGAGTLTLSGGNAYTGATTITGGTLALGASNVLADVTVVSIGNATLAIGSGSTDTLGTLNVTGSATINLGSGAALAFASDSPAWTGSLTITGNFVSGSSLRFGIDANGLTSGQLAAISGPGLSDIALNSEGYLTATVAASGYTTWAATNAGGQGPGLDFDGDGVANGVEFFMNAAPGFTPNPVLNGSNTITWTNGGNIPASAYGSQFVVQASANLVNWTNVLVGELASNTDGPGGSLTYTLIGTAPRFVRLMVTPE